MLSGSKSRKSAEVIYLHGERYERDPLSAVFEDLPDEELQMLAESIKIEGQKLPITINTENGLVLDGWQRLRACQLIDAKPKVVETEIPNPAAFVMAVNEHRRGSTAPTTTQRALLADDLLMLEWQARGGKGRKPTVEKVSEAAGVGTRTVEQIRRAKRWDSANGTDFEEQMRSGRLTAKSADERMRSAKAESEWAEKNRASGRPKETPVVPERPSPSTAKTPPVLVDSAPEDEWKEELRERLIDLSPSGFERFTAAFLRAVGYRDVDVTGRSGDGGIDGIAIAPLGSLRVAFQCKRYEGSVGAPAVRDFRGAIDGSYESGLLITTGTFTSAAKEEASRAAAKTIDLIDGDALFDLLRKHDFGVHTEMIPRVTIDDAYFAQFEDSP